MAASEKGEGGVGVGERKIESLFGVMFSLFRFLSFPLNGGT